MDSSRRNDVIAGLLGVIALGALKLAALLLILSALGCSPFVDLGAAAPPSAPEPAPPPSSRKVTASSMSVSAPAPIPYILAFTSPNPPDSTTLVGEIGPTTYRCTVTLRRCIFIVDPAVAALAGEGLCFYPLADPSNRHCLYNYHVQLQVRQGKRRAVGR